jgi:hypothetical protein
MRIAPAVTLVTMLFLAVCAVARAETVFPGATGRPNNRGDQLIFYYDVRDGFTTFVSIRNEAVSELHVELVFYGPSFTAPFTQTVTVPATRGTDGLPGTGGLTLIDVGALRTSGLAATPGVVFATAVNDMGQPIVSRGLAGNFTVANVATGSAWGSPGAARSAIHPPTPGADACAPKQPNPTLGSVIDGSTVLFAPIQPANADLTAFYDPATLAPAALGGNQLIFFSFVDVPGPTYAAAAAHTQWNFEAIRNTGEGLGPEHVDVSGVVVTDLVSVIGPGISGSSGAMLFSADASSAPLTRLIFFTETLGTFSTGYLLPRR